MSYRYALEELLELLGKRSPRKVDALASTRRRVEQGLLSVGLKIHCLGEGRQFDFLVDSLGGKSRILEVNYYKRETASLCLVLPPVGSARAAVSLVECIENLTCSRIFNNREIQIQVCSPGRIDPKSAAFLAVAFYLGSDFLRRYTLADFATTFSPLTFQLGANHFDNKYTRGRRLVLYDAAGDFDRDFEWWGRRAHTRRRNLKFWQQGNKNYRTIEPKLPFKNGRTDLLTARSSLDIDNINLVTTLLVHAEHNGYWAHLGLHFKEEVQQLLRGHMLEGILGAPWLRTDDSKQDDDEQFMQAFQELMSSAFDDASRLVKRGDQTLGRKQPGLQSLLAGMRELLQRYRQTLVEESNRLDRGDQS